MMNARIGVEGRELQLPSELYFLMAGVPQIALVERRGYFYIWPYDYDFVVSHARVLARTRLGRARSVTICDFHELRSETAVYRARATRRPSAFPAAGEYGVVNKVSNFLVMPLGDGGHGDAQATERFWEGVEGYHEHLAAERQAPFAHRISAWFADEVLCSLDPQSVLEIGCGAGRNLVHARRAMPELHIAGLDINPHAVKLAREQLPRADVRQGSLYDLGQFPDGSIDVVFSMGVLMHVAHDRVADVVRQMHRCASRAVVHLECHGPSYGFDYHKYPRNYEELYRRIGIDVKSEYAIFPHHDFRSRNSVPFYMALLIGRK